MQWDRLYVDKADGTFADTLVALGLVRLVDEIHQRVGTGGTGSDVRVLNQGSHYRLEVSPALEDAGLDRCPFFMLAPFIGTQKSLGKLPVEASAHNSQVLVQYERERDRRAEYFQMRKQYTEEARQADKRVEEHPLFGSLEALAPYKHWEVLRLINPGALAGYNNLLCQWWEVGHSEAFGEALRLLLRLFASAPNDVDQARASWAALVKSSGLTGRGDVTCLQVYNPSKGKGQNRPKTDWARMDNVSDFWLVELLKASGFYEGAVTKVLRGPGQPSRSNDRKTFVISPVDVRYSDVRSLMDRFRARMVWNETSRRVDVLAGLRFTLVLLQRSVEPEGLELLRTLTGAGPRAVVSSFQAAFYKDLGQSAATMNISTLNLPGWVRVDSKETAAEYVAALTEHESIIRQFREDRGEDIDLLGMYRDFMSGDELDPFFGFTTGYSSWLVSQRERNNRARQFTTDNLGRLLMNTEPDLKGIVESEGFQRLAYAIRQATVTAQYRKKQGDRRYDVHYGLGQRLARKAPKTEDFVAELMDFIRSYNAENAQVMENRPAPYRRSIRTTDVEEVVGLLDRYGSRLVGNMLIAYGYAREPYEPDTAQAEPEAEPSAEEPAE